jgi:hypothetical protein
MPDMMFCSLPPVHESNDKAVIDWAVARCTSGSAKAA